MGLNLRQLSFYIWRSRYERTGLQSQEYKPVFTRYIGVDDAEEYDDILRTLKDKMAEVPYAVCFDGSIPMDAEFGIIDYVGRELENMDITRLSQQDIVLFDNNLEYNKIFLGALETVVNLAIQQENFVNKSVRNNFILKLIVWTYSYIRPIYETFTEPVSPKCVYYGEITKHEAYFLMMLHIMAFDVLYINPLNDTIFPALDKYSLSKVEKGMEIVPMESWTVKAARGSYINEEQSTTMIFSESIDQELFNNQSVFKPWQFQNGTTSSLFLNSTIHDLPNIYPAPAKARQGFKVKGNKTVVVPHLFFQIDGVFNDRRAYKSLCQTLVSTPNTYVVNGEGMGIIEVGPTEEQKSELVFCQAGDGTYRPKDLQKLSFYQWDKYRDSLELFMLNKINEVLQDNLFKHRMSSQEQITFIADILMLDPKIIRMIDSFDFPNNIPKIVFRLEDEFQIPNRVCLVLGYLAEIGFDIVILCPSGLTNIDTIFDPKKYTQVRLDEMVYDYKFNLTAQNTMKNTGSTAKGFLKKIFGR